MRAFTGALFEYSLSCTTSSDDCKWVDTPLRLRERVIKEKRHTVVKEKSKHQVYTLLIEVGRKEGDGLPDHASGAALMCYSSGVDEAEAVRETVALMKQAGLAPLDVRLRVLE